MHPPFDTEKLLTLMDKESVDLLLATSRHNVRYLLGGYTFFFFAHMDAIGTSRYLPVVGIPRGHLDASFYVGNAMERWQQEVEPLWVRNVKDAAWTTVHSAEGAASCIDRLGLAGGTIAVERSFLPADAFDALRHNLPAARLVEAHPLLEELRAVKSARELALLREASEAIVACMLEVMQTSSPGVTTGEIARRMHQEEVARGLNFEYALVCTGPSFNRAPSGARWEEGNVLSIDSGGNNEGYIGDLCRMAVMGRPTELMRDLLAEVQAVQAAARGAIHGGAMGGTVYERALAEQARCAHGDQMHFTAHGMGLISHEAPHLTGSGPVPYPATHESRPLDAGMVLSLETDLRNPQVGFVKLEDTVVVTPEGFEAYGDEARNWIVVEG